MLKSRIDDSTSNDPVGRNRQSSESASVDDDYSMPKPFDARCPRINFKNALTQKVLDL